MATTKDDIRWWLENAQREDQENTHLIVATDTFDMSDYPVYIKASDPVDAIDQVHKISSKNMTRVTEVYHLASNWEEQLNERRAFNF